MSSYQFTADGENNIITITFDSTFTNGGIVKVPAVGYAGIGNGSQAITLVGLPAGFHFILDLSLLVTNFTIKAFALSQLPIHEVIFSTAETTINTSAFQGSLLKKITLTDTLSCVGTNIFKECMQLKDLIITEGVQAIQESMFEKCNGLGNVIIPASVKQIYQKGFYETHFDSLSFVNGIETIGISAFQDSYIQELVLPTSLISIGTNAFSGCNRMTELIIPSFADQCEFGTGVFQNCLSLINIVLGENMYDGTNENSLGKNIFQGCSVLKSVQFYKNIKYISQQAFADCTNLKTLTFDTEQQNMISLGDNCFENCGFEYIYFPEHVSSFKSQCFKNCSKLVQIIIDAESPDINTTSILTGCNQLREIILGYNFQQMTTGPSDIPPMNGESLPQYYIYVYSIEKAVLLQNAFEQRYKGFVISKPYCNRKFVNHKAIYEDEHDVGYVMYTLQSANNTFNDCTFYFRSASSTTSVVVITASDGGVLKNCVKMFSTTVDVEGKTIQKIFYDTISMSWCFQSTNGIVRPISNITSEHILQNNFMCEDVYDGRILTINGSNLSTCDMYALSNLTKNGKVFINHLNRVKMTSNKNDTSYLIEIRIITQGNPVFEIEDLDSNQFNMIGENCTVVLEGTVKDRSTQWSIQAAKIIIHTLWVDYTVFQGQKEDGTILKKVECVKIDEEPLIKFTANQIINFQLIQNKNDLIIHPNSTDMNAIYYSSGWSM